MADKHKILKRYPNVFLLPPSSSYDPLTHGTLFTHLCSIDQMKWLQQAITFFIDVSILFRVCRMIASETFSSDETLVQKKTRKTKFKFFLPELDMMVHSSKTIIHFLLITPPIFCILTCYQETQLTHFSPIQTTHTKSAKKEQWKYIWTTKLINSP